MLKKFLIFLGGIWITLTALMIVLLIINPSSQNEQKLADVPLHIYLDTSISFYEYQKAALSFIEDIRSVWDFPIELTPFASDVAPARSLDHTGDQPAEPLTRIQTFERQTRFEALAETLKFLPPREPKIVLSDFVFNDFFNPVQDETTFFHNMRPPDRKHDFAIFIENDSSDYRPETLQELSSPNSSSSPNQYPLTIRLTLYASKVPTQARITLKTLHPYQSTLYTARVTLQNRIETLSIPVLVTPVQFLTLQAVLTLQSQASSSSALRYTDSINLLGDSDNIPVALFAFKPFKDVGLIKRTLKRYGFFSVSAYTFLRSGSTNQRTLDSFTTQYRNFLTALANRKSSGAVGSQTPLIIAMGAEPEIIAFLQNQEHPFINFPKIAIKAKDSAPLSASTFQFQYEFLNIAGTQSASQALWTEAAPFITTQSRSPSDTVTYYQRNPSGSSFLFRRNNEIYIGLNGFYELNRALIASVSASDADVFWVRLLESLHAETAASKKKSYPHNYFLGEPLKATYLIKSLSPLTTNVSGDVIVPPSLSRTGAYRLKDTYYHYRADLREYFPLYDLDEAAFSSQSAILEAIRELSQRYEQDTIISLRPLRTYQFPYILLLAFFLSYLLTKATYTYL